MIINFNSGCDNDIMYKEKKNNNQLVTTHTHSGGEKGNRLHKHKKKLINFVFLILMIGQELVHHHCLIQTRPIKIKGEEQERVCGQGTRLI